MVTTIKAICLTLLYAIAHYSAYSQDTIRICSYNIDRWSESDSVHIPSIRKILEAIDADIIMIQGIASLPAFFTFNKHITDSITPHLIGSTFIKDTQDSYIAIYFNRDKFINSKQIRIDAKTTDFLILPLTHIDYGIRLNIASVRLINAIDTLEEKEKMQEVEQILDTIKTINNIVLGGSLYMRSADEKTYQNLINEGVLSDPISSLGMWSANPSFANLHTSSTRFELSDSSLNGGLKNRSDQILLSESVLKNYKHDSYVTYGNDGMHFKKSVNSPANLVVNSDIADALYTVSSHLPVYLDIVLVPATSVENQEFDYNKILKMNLQ